MKNTIPEKVLVFGTYDVFHPGHEHHLRKAKLRGEKLYVVVARDETVKKMKGVNPQNSEKKRMARIKSLDFVHKVYLGGEGDKYKIIEKIRPDLICLGYDQTHFTRGLKEALKRRGLNPKIVRFREAHLPEKYKSSLIRKRK